MEELIILNQVHELVNSYTAKKGLTEEKFKNLSPLIEKATEDEKAYIKIEAQILNLWIEDDKLDSNLLITDENGNLINPGVKNIIKHQTYIQQRFTAVQNKELKIKYGLVLRYIVENKNDAIAKEIIDTCFSIIESIPPSELDLSFRNYAIIPLRLSKQIKYKHQKALDLYLMITKENTDLTVVLTSYFLKAGIQVEPEYYRTLNVLIEKLFEASSDKPSIILAWNYCPLGIKIGTKLKDGSLVKLWYKRQGECFLNYGLEKEIEEMNEEKPSFLGAYTIIHDSLSPLKKSGDKNLLKVATLNFARIKNKLALPNISVELSLEDSQIVTSEIEKHVEIISGLSPDKLILFLAVSTEIFPSSDSALFKSSGATFLQDLAVSYRINHYNNNAVREKDDLASKEKRRAFDTYHLYIQCYFRIFLARLLDHTFRNGTFNAESIINQMQRSWLGQDLSHNIHGINHSYNWVSLTAPSIIELQKQLTLEYLTGNRGNYVLVLDSLVLKVEGIIRDFAKFHNVPTSRIKENKTIEKTLEELLSEQEVRAKIGEQNYMLLTYLYSSEMGLNIRNNAAHGLYRHYDYDLFKTYLVLLSILRMSAYSFVAKD